MLTNVQEAKESSHRLGNDRDHRLRLSDGLLLN